MKLRAIRVAEVGRFARPAAIEGLSGGLDVLDGPNEFGKSTLFRALRALFLIEHTSKAAKTIGTLVPYAGGAPLIEADFDIDGRSWRLTKRFQRAPRAELRELPSGTLVARGLEAEARLAEMAGAGGQLAGRLGLVWIGQGQALEITAPEPGEARTSLLRAVEAEVAELTGGRLAGLVRDRVRAGLEAQLTPTLRGPRRDGAYDRLLSRREDVAARLSDAERRATDTEASRRRAGELEQQRERLTDKAHITCLEAERRAADAALATAVEAASALDAARQLASSLAASEERAIKDLADFDAAASELNALDDKSEDNRTATARNDAAIDAAKSALEDCRQSGQQLKLAKSGLEAQLARQRLSERLAQRRTKLEDARRLEAEIAEATAALLGDPATNQRLDGLERAVREATLARDRLALQATRLTVSYAAGASAAVAANGRKLADGETVAALEPLTIAIDGVGRIEVEPGTSNDRAAVGDLLAHAEREIARHLAAIGATDVEAARAAHLRRRDRDRALQDAINRSRLLAPDGVAHIASEVAGDEAELSALTTALATPPTAGEDMPPAEVERAIRDATADYEAARERWQVLAEDLRKLEGERASLAAQAEYLVRSRTSILAQIGEPAQRADRRTALLSAREEIAKSRRAADERHASLVTAAPDTETLARLRRSAEAARGRLAEHAASLHSIDVELARLTTELDIADGLGLGLEIGRLTDERDRIATDIATMERDIAAMRLLREALDDARAKAAARTGQPVVDRLAAAVTALLGPSAIELDEALAPVSIGRSGHSEPIANLSDGTREQIAVLTRLAYARLLAETGSPAPVILDDPFAYADPERLGKVFAGLREAAARHQVIVFTCRGDLFAPLGGQRLALTAWKPPEL
ncbi:MAG: hypothetical protein NW205_02920 [Hyphomicrobiaceae bacterium]|nr:hypothetical protein [Hyphomicrobiaceae bacterium]